MASPRSFAKLFETECGQLLVTVEFDDDQDTYGIRFRGASYRGVVPAITPGGWEQIEDAEKALADTDQARADEVAKMLRETVERLTP
jgi:hypothetical protein